MTEQQIPPLPVSSVRSIGSDDEPYLYPETGERSAVASYLRPCIYLPRAERTHVPAAPSELFCAFRDDWESPEVNGAFDLGEFAEIRLSEVPDDGTHETRLFRRFLHLCATVLPRPYEEFARKWGLTPQVA
jgi:hypothetical protein